MVLLLLVSLNGRIQARRLQHPGLLRPQPMKMRVATAITAKPPRKGRRRPLRRAAHKGNGHHAQPSDGAVEAYGPAPMGLGGQVHDECVANCLADLTGPRDGKGRRKPTGDRTRHQEGAQQEGRPVWAQQVDQLSCRRQQVEEHQCPRTTQTVRTGAPGAVVQRIKHLLQRAIGTITGPLARGASR